jgi:hypothetical protein
MRVTSIELRPEGSSEVIQLSFRDPRSLNLYQCKSIAPLDADELIPQFYGMSEDSTKRYYQMTQKKRQPVVLIGLNPRYGEPDDNSYSELRDRLYRLIQSSRTGVIDIVFQADDVDVAIISGTVAKLAAAHFTSKPEVQITFNCQNPMLKSPDRFYLVGGPGQPPVVEDDITIVDEVSTAANGFRFEAEFNAAYSSFVIAPPGMSPEWVFDVRPYGGFLSGDVLHFSSEVGNKHLYIQREGSTIHLGDAIQTNSIWPILFPGANAFHTNHAVQWNKIDHYLTYWGV